MDAATIIRDTRTRAGMTLRALAAHAATSHSALAAYEAGRREPTTATLHRIVRAAGFELDVAVRPRVRVVDGIDRGRELAAALALAEQFPARHAERIEAPVFGRA